MADVKVLIEGYAKKVKKGWIASSTTCLITTKNKKIITDPGCNRKKLRDALNKEKVKAEDIEIIETPGHVLEHISLIVNSPKGKIGIAGDAIWWLDDEKQVFDLKQKDHAQAKGMDMETLIGSRRKLVESADYIVPGHGKMFKVKK